ncbi:MAG: branched-chain amino acid ABC transporter permease [Thermoleophilia bacterium]|nr:branched-chain amino acid ABC transporter permease [Thermoleophilia bacterium]
MTGFLQVFLDGLSLGSSYSLLALGLTMVFGVLGLVNFAFGDMIVWTAFLAVELTSIGLPLPAVIPLTLVGSVALSMFVGEVVFRRVGTQNPLSLLLVSFGLSLVLVALAVQVFGELALMFPSPTALNTVLQVDGLQISMLSLVNVAVAAVILAALFVLLNRSRLGLALRATAENARTARLMAVRPKSMVRLSFAITGVIGGVIALLWFMKVGTVTPRSGLDITLKAFIALVIGGLGSARGAVAGGFALGFAEAALASWLPVDLRGLQQALAFVVVVILLVLRPQGIGGRLLDVSR